MDCLSEAGADPARCADLALQTAELMAFHLPANHPTLARLRSIAGRELERAGNRDRGAAVARERNQGFLGCPASLRGTGSCAATR